MARVKGTTKNKNQDKPKTPRKQCVGECKKELPLDKFYNTNNKMFPDGRVNICKDCIKKMISYDNFDSILDVLRQMDIPFIKEYWIKAEQAKTDSFGTYVRMANSLKQLNGMTWKDSVFETSKKSDIQEVITDQVPSSLNPQKENNTGYELEELKEKYGYGYPDDEYILFEKKYQQLRTSFQLLTTMHEEYFREYCINKVKETLAKAKGDFKQAKEWAAMVKDVAEAGKLKPSQMSKADLSAGLDGFGQLARMVEENYEIQPILPKFIEQPKDKVDVVLWCFVNYVRDIKGLPECDYKEIYDFYERRKAEYEPQILDNKLNIAKEVDEDV